MYSQEFSFLFQDIRNKENAINHSSTNQKKTTIEISTRGNELASMVSWIIFSCAFSFQSELKFDEYFESQFTIRYDVIEI